MENQESLVIGLDRDRKVLKVINAFAIDLIAIPSKSELAWYLVREVVGKLGFDDCVVYFLDRRRKLLRQHAAIGINKNPTSNEIVNALEVSLGEGITGHVALSNRAIIVNDLDKDSRYIPDVAHARSEICVPLSIDGQVVGVIDCEDYRANHFNDFHLETLTTIAAMTSARLKSLEQDRNLGVVDEITRKSQNLRHAVKLTKVGHVTWDGIERRTVHCTTEYAQIHGVSADEYVAITNSYDAVLNWIHEEDRDRYDATMTHTIEMQTSYDITYRLVAIGGEIRHVREIADTVYNKDGQLVQTTGAMQDITDQERVYEELKKSHSIQAAVLSNISDGVSMSDAGGRLIAYNQRFLEINDFPPELMKGETTYEDLVRFSAERGDYGAGNIERLVTERHNRIHASDVSVTEKVRSDGRITEIHRRSLPDGGMIITDRDVTEPRRVREQLQKTHDNLERQVEERTKMLRESEAISTSAVKLARLGYCTRRTVDNACVYCSDLYAALHGVSTTEYIANASAGVNAHKFIHVEDQKRCENAIDRLKNGEATHLEYRINLPGENVRWVREIADPLFASDGTVFEIQYVAQDITDQKRIEDELRKARDDLETRVAERTNELHESEARLKRAAEIARVGHWVWDEIQGKTTFCSDMNAAIHHQTVDEFHISTSSIEGALNRVHPDDREAYSVAIRHAEENKSGYEIQLRIPGPDGDITHVREITQAILDADGRHIQTVGVTMDVTEQKKIERQLNKSEERFKQIAYVSSDWIWEMDADLRFSFLSERFFDVTHVQPARLLGKTLLETGISGMNSKLWRSQLQRLERHDPFRNFEYSREIDGETLWVSINGQPVFGEGGQFGGYRGVSTNITDRVRTEQALRTSENSYRSLATIAPAGIFRADTDGKVVYVNEKWSELSGISLEDSLNDGWGSTLFPQDRQRAVEEWKQFLKNGTPYEVEYRCQRPNEQIVYCYAQAVEEKNSNGDTIGYVGTVIDITERRNAEAEVARARIELEARVIRRTWELETAMVEAEDANRAKSEFLAAMSHELRTPLNAISGFSEMIKGEYFGTIGSDKYKEYASDIMSSSDHLLNLVNDILDLSAIESGEQKLNLEALNINDVISDCTPVIAKSTNDKNIEFCVLVPNDIPKILADRRAIKQILLNLLSNSVKFTPQGGKIDLSVATAGGNHIISVQDTGEGIPDDKLPLITEPFVRKSSDPHTAQEGIGLGLAIVKSIVSLHHGEITIESAVNVGTTVKVILPTTTQMH